MVQSHPHALNKFNFVSGYAKGYFACELHMQKHFIMAVAVSYSKWQQ
jgi:hypothetical protein